jgi:hypothetical protein
MTTDEKDQQRIEGTVFTANQVQKLKVVVVIMGILLVLGFFVLIAGLVNEARKLQDKDKGTVVSVSRQVIPVLNAGDKIVSTAMFDNKVAITVQTTKAVKLVVIDTGLGIIISSTCLTEEECSP